MSRKRTYEGTTGRVFGFLWGALWLTIGVGLLSMFGVRNDLFPQGLQNFLVGIAPWLETNVDNPSMGGTVELILVGLFILFCVGYGLYNIGRTIFESDYSITFSRGRHP